MISVSFFIFGRANEQNNPGEIKPNNPNCYQFIFELIQFACHWILAGFNSAYRRAARISRNGRGNQQYRLSKFINEAARYNCGNIILLVGVGLGHLFW